MSKVGADDSDEDVVRIGARIRVRDEDGEDEFALVPHYEDGEDEFALVPHYEADATADRVSAESPIGRALLGRRVGERVRFRAPCGIVGVTVVAIR